MLRKPTMRRSALASSPSRPRLRSSASKASREDCGTPSRWLATRCMARSIVALQARCKFERTQSSTITMSSRAGSPRRSSRMRFRQRSTMATLLRTTSSSAVRLHEGFDGCGALFVQARIVAERVHLELVQRPILGRGEPAALPDNLPRRTLEARARSIESTSTCSCSARRWAAAKTRAGSSGTRAKKARSKSPRRGRGHWLASRTRTRQSTSPAARAPAPGAVLRPASRRRASLRAGVAAQSRCA